MDPLEVLGIGSAFMVLYAFVGNEYGMFPARSYKYDMLNLLGATGLFFYAFATGVIPFMLTNAVWAAVSGLDVWKHLKKRHGKYPIRSLRKLLKQGMYRLMRG
jgi:hypothetical protein